MSIVFLSVTIFLLGFIIIMNMMSMFAVTEILSMIMIAVPTLFFAKSRNDTGHATRLFIFYIVGFCVRFVVLTRLGVGGSLLLPINIADQTTLQICGIQTIATLFLYYILLYIMSTRNCKKALAETKDINSVKKSNIVIKENSIFNVFTVSMIINMILFIFMYDLQPFSMNMLIFIFIAVCVSMMYQIHVIGLVRARKEEIMVGEAKKVTPIE